MPILKKKKRIVNKNPYAGNDSKPFAKPTDEQVMGEMAYGAPYYRPGTNDVYVNPDGSTARESKFLTSKDAANALGIAFNPKWTHVPEDDNKFAYDPHYGNMSEFERAFAYARTKGIKLFKFKGKLYNSNMK